MDADGRAVGGSPMNDQELTERIVLIESMMRAGRKSTEYWGWNFLLWGIAYLVAVAWSNFLPQAGGARLAWPVTMIFAVAADGDDCAPPGAASAANGQEPQPDMRSGRRWAAASSYSRFPVAYDRAYGGTCVHRGDRSPAGGRARCERQHIALADTGGCGSGVVGGGDRELLRERGRHSDYFSDSDADLQYRLWDLPDDPGEPGQGAGAGCRGSGLQHA